MGTRECIPLARDQVHDALFGYFRQPECALVLDRSDQPIGNGDAAVLAHGAEALLDASAAAPCPEAVVGKLDALVGDDMPWMGDGQRWGSA